MKKAVNQVKSKHSPTYEPNSLEEFIEWAKQVVPLSLALKFEMLYYSDTWNYQGTMPEWPLKMQLAIEHPEFLDWVISFAGSTQDKEFAKGVTNGVKLLVLAANSLACDDDGETLLPPRYD